MKYLVILDKVIEKIQIVLSISLFAAIVILGTLQVFFRFALNSSLAWSEELIRFLFIWLVFCASSVTVRTDGHVAIDFLTLKAKPKIHAGIFIVTRLLCVAFLIVMIPAGIELTQKSAMSRAAILPVSFKYVYASFVVGSVMMVLSYAGTIPRYVNNILKGEN